MRQNNPYEFPAAVSHAEIVRENELKPAALLKRIEQLEKDLKRLKKEVRR